MDDVIEDRDRPRWGRIAVLAGAGLLAVAALVFGLTQLVTGAPETSPSPSPSSPSATPTSTPTQNTDDEDDDVPGMSSDFSPLLPEAMNGQEAIDALGDRIETAAKRNGKTVEELEELLLRDTTAHISPNGYLVYLDDFGGNG